MGLFIHDATQFEDREVSRFITLLPGHIIDITVLVYQILFHTDGKYAMYIKTDQTLFSKLDEMSLKDTSFIYITSLPSKQ